RDIVVSFVGRADAAGVDLEAEGLDAPVVAMASPTLLEGVLTNLIDNALRYGAGGSPATLTITVEPRDRRVHIAGTDTGARSQRSDRARAGDGAAAARTHRRALGAGQRRCAARRRRRPRPRDRVALRGGDEGLADARGGPSWPRPECGARARRRPRKRRGRARGDERGYGSFWKPNTGGFISQLTPSSPTLPAAFARELDFAVPAMTSGAVRLRPLPLVGPVGCMKVLP